MHRIVALKVEMDVNHIAFKGKGLEWIPTGLDRFKGEYPLFIITLTHSNRKVTMLVNRFITNYSVLLRFATHSKLDLLQKKNLNKL